jgi:hypothetical protein
MKAQLMIQILFSNYLVTQGSFEVITIRKRPSRLLKQTLKPEGHYLGFRRMDLLVGLTHPNTNRSKMRSKETVEVLAELFFSLPSFLLGMIRYVNVTGYLGCLRQKTTIFIGAPLFKLTDKGLVWKETGSYRKCLRSLLQYMCIY